MSANQLWKCARVLHDIATLAHTMEQLAAWTRAERLAWGQGALPPSTTMPIRLAVGQNRIAGRIILQIGRKSLNDFPPDYSERNVTSIVSANGGGGDPLKRISKNIAR